MGIFYYILNVYKGFLISPDSFTVKNYFQKLNFYFIIRKYC